MIQDDILRRTSGNVKGGMKVGKWRFEGIVNYNHQRLLQLLRIFITNCYNLQQIFQLQDGGL